MAGDTISLRIDHDEVGSLEVSIKSDEDISLMLDGFTKEFTPTGGSGVVVTKLTKKLGKLEGLQIVYEKENNTLEFLQNIQNHKNSATITWEHIDGDIWSFSGSIEGDINHNSNSGFIECSFTAVSQIKRIA